MVFHAHLLPDETSKTFPKKVRGGLPGHSFLLQLAADVTHEVLGKGTKVTFPEHSHSAGKF